MEDADIPDPENAKLGHHRGVIEEFLSCVRTGEMPETVCTDNIKSLAMVFAAIDSAATGRRVEIHPSHP
jgi:predicted dehydrogenase